ncbi:MAG: hypothetical protein ACE1ZA_07255, partial [Pseudomonadales bacterium]
YETVVDNALYVAAWQGTVSVTNEAGETILGFGQDADFARVSGANRRPITLLEAPPQLLESVDPDLKEFVQGARLGLGFEIIPEEADLSQIGFATFGGPNAQGPLSGAATDGSDGSPLFFDPSAQAALRQGSASTTFVGTPIVNGSPVQGVSWGTWGGGPVEFETLAGGVQPISRPVFWLTMAPTTSLPLSNFYNLSSSAGQITTLGSGSGPGPVQVTSFTANVNFATGALTLGNMNVTDGGVNWVTNFTGSVNGPSFSATLGATSFVGAGLAAEGTIVGGVTGPGASTIGGVFDFQQTSDPTNVHVEGAFVGAP